MAAGIRTATSDDGSSQRSTGRRWITRALVVPRQLVGALGATTLALLLLAVLAASWILCVIGIGFLFLPLCLGAVRPLADRERVRLTRWGDPVVSPAAPVPAPRDHLVDPTARRELGWLALQGTVGFILGVVGVLLPVAAVGALSFPWWSTMLPTATALPVWASWAGWTLSDRAGAYGVAAIGLGLLVAFVLVAPTLAVLQGIPGRLLLTPPDKGDMSIRVAELTATRAAALDAHAVELRRIERALHDGTQNRLVAVNVLLGAARRAVVRDPAAAIESIERAQTANEAALADLRSVARTILPPVLTDRGLRGALDGLAAASPIPCRLRVDLMTRCAAATEATAYFAVAEGLTNAARHSDASEIMVTVRSDTDRLYVSVQDNGRGGAGEQGGSGLLGIRRRAAALDGAMTVSSPLGGPTRLEVQLPCGS